MKTLLTATAIILSMTAAASAAETPRGTSDVLAGGPVYSNAEVYALCWFTNFGTTNVTPTSQSLYTYGSTTAISAVDTCATGTAVSPNQMCYIESYSNELVSGASCKVTFSSAVTNVRGTVQAVDSSDDSVDSAELR